MDFGTAVVLVTMTPIFVVLIAVVAFLVSEDISEARFYAGLSARRARR